MAEQGSATKQLKPTLGFWDLMGSSIGQIVGAGIMSMLPAALAMTGRSIPFAFLIAAAITCARSIPYIFISSVVRLRGGTYTQVAMLAGDTFAGMFVITNIFSNISLAMYCISLSSYVGDLFQWTDSTEKWVAIGVLVFFYALNLIGVDMFAKVQNVLVIVLIFSLTIFAVMGIGKVNWSGYFVQDEGWMTGGLMGLCQAGALLSFATGGAHLILNFSAEAKNPTRDLPIVIIASTLLVAVLYGVIAFVAAGVLPIEQVSGQNLTLVANVVLNKPLYILFVLGGAGCALASTLNNEFATNPKPIMQMCDDGWLPAKVASLNKKRVPYVIETILFLISGVCILTGLSVSALGQMTQVTGTVTNVVIAVGTMNIPKLVPEAWERSKFKVSNGVLKTLCAIGVASALFNGYMNASDLTPTLLIINIGVLVAAYIFGKIRSKTVHMDISYELVD